MPMGLDNANCSKNYVENSMLWPCGLECQFLGLCYYAYGAKNLPPHPFALDRIMSHPAPLHTAKERMTAENPPAISG